MSNSKQIELEEAISDELKVKLKRAANYATCEHCGKTIRFLITRKNQKYIPVDAESTDQNDRYYDHSVHRTHFATCSNPALFRRPKEGNNGILESLTLKTTP